MKPPLPSISEHALFRYLERVKGFDMAHYRLELQNLLTPYVSIGAKRVVINGWSYEFEANALITVQPPKNGKQRRRTGPYYPARDPG